MEKTDAYRKGSGSSKKWDGGPGGPGSGPYGGGPRGPPRGLDNVPCLPVAHAVANVLRWWFPLSTRPNLLLGDWSIVMNGLPPTVHHSCIELCNNCLEQNQMTARPFRPALDTGYENAKLSCNSAQIFDSHLATPSSCNIGKSIRPIRKGQ
ncbi:hypothetical protein NC651_013806 [Populus alba x Populus x berolinensis]|nr:hypothetical protein NC651_013806 [Populus alba x Populus x berolinensis]